LITDIEDIEALIEFYTMICNIELDLEDCARMASTLAKGGIQPESEVRVFCPENVKNALSLMLTSGMNMYSGEWAYRVGLPAKSGYSGIIMMVVPNVCGIAVYSPLVHHANSLKGKELLI